LKCIDVKERERERRRGNKTRHFREKKNEIDLKGIAEKGVKKITVKEFIKEMKRFSC
jgi:hypothetical protein